MKLTNKENVKQIVLIITGILFMCVGYFNYSLDDKSKTIEVSRKRRCKRNKFRRCSISKYRTSNKL